ncbi:hypothetical protein IB256_21460 [Pseudomonas sp. PDM17]|uniref:hypothetical protein n=1 Tax=Pseudomonas sp. PDM17 TaxID=2769285 RepID=UPI001783C8A7|nr:hypothetical protein [Pseudomonas sp. PDM17]MBD9503370.1 hypothetical protein [Pseudomonas sp. PDM17]
MYANENNDRIQEYIKTQKLKKSLQSLIIIAFAFTTLMFLARFERTFPSDISDILTSISITVTCVLIVYYYLQTRPIFLPRNIIERTTLQELKAARSSLEELENLLSMYEGSDNPNSTELKPLKERIKSSYIGLCQEWFSPRNMLNLDDSLLATKTGILILRNNLSTTRIHILELISQEHEDQNTENRESERKIERTRLLGERAHSRITGEIAQLSKRANIYISIGTAITIIAGYILYLAAQDSYKSIITTDGSNLNELLQPKILLGVTVKISIVIFIEIFAFYFLKLHKEIMENIKYYQNEITNIDLKMAGLNASESSDECMKIAVEELIKTERNFIIKDKHTTIELEKRKHESTTTKDLIDTIFKAIKIKEK